MKTSFYVSVAFAVMNAVAVAGCGSGSNGDSGNQAAPTDPSGLSADQLRNGIGPVSSLDLGPVDEAMAERGEAIFQTKCSACHKLDSRYVGPALGDVLSRRTPEFVMNMILNPAEMIEKHPEVKALFAQYLTPMANQNLTQEDARAVLEYFRHESEDTPGDEEG